MEAKFPQAIFNDPPEEIDTSATLNNAIISLH